MDKNIKHLTTRLEQRLARLCSSSLLEDTHKACIRTAPVYLGELYHCDRPIPSGKMYEIVIDDAATWTSAFYKLSPLKDYFTPRSSGVGYRLRPDFECSVDHLIPKGLGRDHPRNYAFMSRRLNTSFGDGELDEKFATMSAHVRRKAYEFARAANDATKVAFASWLRALPAPPGAKTV